MDCIQFLNIGYGNMVCANHIIAILSPDSAPIKRIVQESKDKEYLLMPLMAENKKCYYNGYRIGCTFLPTYQ